MKFLLVVAALLLSAPSFAGGGGCSECSLAYRCQDQDGRAHLTLESIEGYAVQGGLSYKTTSDELETAWMSVHDDYYTETHVVVDFYLETYEGRALRFQRFELFLPRKGYNKVKSAPGVLIGKDLKLPLNCEGPGFYDDEIKPRL